MLGASILSNVDPLLRQMLGEGSKFAACGDWTPDGAEGGEE